MLVSRPELVYDHIVEFPVETRFLKLPIQAFLELEGIVPLAPQIAMLNAVNNPQYRFLVGALSRRSGKTFIANAIAFLKAMEPNTNILVVSPNYSLTAISWREQEKLLLKHGIEIKSKNKTEKTITLLNGSMLRFGSVNQADSLVGVSYSLILFDECALDPAGEEAFNIQLRPTLDRPGSKAIFISTPRRDNYFKTFYERGFDDDFKDWVSVHSTCLDNDRMSKEDVAAAKRSMSRAEFEQEYMASFTRMENAIYDSFDIERHVIDTSEMDFSNTFEWETILSIDPGHKDPTAALILKYNSDTEKFYIVFEYQEAGKSTAQHAAVLVPAYEKYQVDMVFIDSAAAQTRNDLASMYDLPSNPAQKSVLDGISFVQSVIENDRLYVDSRCTGVIKAITNYRWDNKVGLTKEKPLHDMSSHYCDALRYALYSSVR